MLDDPDLQREAFRRMTRIRLFEEEVANLLRQGEMFGGAHTCIGQEAAVVGALLAVTDDDYMTGTHRSHGHPIGKGAAVGPLVAELMGRATGVCGGKGGSMHLADFSVGSLGESGIVASGMPIAVGAGLSARMRKSGQVCVCFFGDGASNEGAFHESLNLAAVWKLPVIFLCENNGYGITTPASQVMAIDDVACRAAGYGMPGEIVDGQDVFAVYEATSRAVARARAGEGPTLVEAKTYRFVEHSLGLSLKYRDEDEVERWRTERDPIALFRARVEGSNDLSAAELDAIAAAERAALDAATRAAREAPFPDAAARYEGMYTSPVPLPELESPL